MMTTFFLNTCVTSVSKKKNRLDQEGFMPQESKRKTYACSCKWNTASFNCNSVTTYFLYLTPDITDGSQLSIWQNEQAHLFGSHHVVKRIKKPPHSPNAPSCHCCSYTARRYYAALGLFSISLAQSFIWSSLLTNAEQGQIKTI